MAFALDLHPPGVILQRSPPVRGISRLRHHVLGIVGVARRGPLHRPVRIQSVPDFVRVFGGTTAQGYLGPAVEGFFANGGAAAWVVRIADPERAAPAAAYLLSPDRRRVRLEATSPGSWGRAMAFRVVRTSTRRFSLLIRPPDAAPELWGGLTFDFNENEDEEDRRVEVILENSAWLRACETSVIPAGATVIRPLTGSSDGDHLQGGADGVAGLTLEHFDGEGIVPFFLADNDEREPQPRPFGLRALERVDEVAIVAIPDIMFAPGPPPPEPPKPKPPSCELLELAADLPDRLPQETLETRSALAPDQRLFLQQRLIAHCRELRDRVAILDADLEIATAKREIAITRAIEQRRQFSDDFGALYFPWLHTAGAGVPTPLPPSGHVAGIYARVALENDVHKPPANEVLAGVAGVTWDGVDGDHTRLNGQHVNVIRVIAGRGIRVMGARTLLRDGPLGFVNVRRLVNLIAESIDRETQWIPFEPNNPDLQDVVGRVVRNFLDGLWRRGMLEGASPKAAYSVRCDASVNPPAETERGRLICEIGIRPPWPVEFIFLHLTKSETGVVLDTLAGTENA